MRLRLGRVRYINCEPVYYALEHGLVPADCDITDGTPAELNARLRVGALDVSVVSAMEPALRPEAYWLLPDLAIACDGPVESVLLVSRRPPEELDHRLVALSRHSLTSVYLVKLLLEKAYHVRPQYAEDDRAGEAEARLVIGDEALRLGPQFPHSLDLGKAWYTLTGLPFVFAVWAVRAEVWASAAAEVRAVHQARSRWPRPTPGPTRRACWPWRKSASHCRPTRVAGICASASASTSAPRHLEGLQTFLAMLAEAGALPGVPSLRFISV